jgi:hypothetical protein
LFFYLTTFFLTIIVINIVVAIIGDTYDRVQSQEKIASNYERALLIYQYEKKMSKTTIEKLKKKSKLFVIK